MGFFYLKIILLFFVLCYNSGVMVLYIGGVLMAYFLKVTKQQSRTYLSIYESFYSPETKGTKHRSYRSLGNIQKLIDSGIDDPIAYFQKEVDRLNAQRKAENANKKINDRLIGEVSPEKYLGYFPLANILNTLDVKDHFNYMQSTRYFQFNVYDIFSSLVFARAVAPLSKHKTFHDVLPSLLNEVDFSYDQLLDAVEFLGSEYQKFTEILTVATADNFGIDTKHTFFDCTNFYFEIDKENDFQRRGPSKEMRHDPIVGLGLLLDANMIPIGMRMYPGNESEKPIIRNIIEATDKCDGYIFSKSVKQLVDKEKTWVLLENDFHDVLDSKGNIIYRYKSCIDNYTYEYKDENGIKHSKTVKEKRVCTFSPKLQRKKLMEIDKMIERAQRLRASEAKKEEYGESARYVNFVDRDGKKAHTVLNEEKIDMDRKLAGFNLLITSEYKMEDQQIYEAYHNLWRIEESFRVMKSELDARPVYLQKENSIKGHFLICYTTVLLIRLFQFKILNNEYSTSDICSFIKEFKVVQINDSRYINMTRSSDFITKLSALLKQPITNYYLTNKQIKMMHTR